MSISHTDLKSIADELKKSNKEVYLRSAVSRCYYASFHFLRNNLVDLYSDNRQKRHLRDITHGPLISLLSNYKTSNKLSATLHDFHVKRIKSDYHLNINNEFNRNNVDLIFKFYFKITELWEGTDKEKLKSDLEPSINAHAGIAN